MRVTEKGQVTIPIAVRRKTGILPNTDVEFVVSGKDAIIRKCGKSRRGGRLIAAMRGRATKRLSTSQIMALTRGE